MIYECGSFGWEYTNFDFAGLDRMREDMVYFCQLHMQISLACFYFTQSSCLIS